MIELCQISSHVKCRQNKQLLWLHLLLIFKTISRMSTLTTRHYILWEAYLVTRYIISIKTVSHN